MVKGGSAGHGAGRFALPDRRPRHRALRLPFPRSRDYTPCPYFGCRIFTDALSALLCWLLGGLVGLGTLICAFCLGPFIQFFDRTFSQKVLQYKPNN